MNVKDGLLHHAEVTMPDGSKKVVQVRGGPDLNLDFANIEALALGKVIVLDL